MGKPGYYFSQYLASRKQKDSFLFNVKYEIWLNEGRMWVFYVKIK